MTTSVTPADARESLRFPVLGMTCSTCVGRITRAVKRLPGVEAVRVDLADEAVTVRRDPALATDAALASAIRDAGYEPRLEAAVPVSGTWPRGLLARILGR